MRFFATVATAAAAFANKTAQLKDITVRVTGSGPQAACFTAQPDDLKNVAVCGESAYRFGLRNGSNGFWALTAYKQTAPGAGLSATKEIQHTHCHAGGNGADDNVCDVADTDITLKSD